MAALIDAIDVKRKMTFEYENVPYSAWTRRYPRRRHGAGRRWCGCEMRNMLTRAVFDKTFKAGEKFKEPDLETVDASYLYSDGDGSYFLNQESFETLALAAEMVKDALDLLVEGTIVKIDMYNGNPIGLELPAQVELTVAYTEPGVRGDTASGSVTKPARLETGAEVRVPFYIKEGERIKVATETREFAGRA